MTAITPELVSQRIQSWAEQQPDLLAVILFGSRARNTAGPSSDWDICCIVNSGHEHRYAAWYFNVERWKDEFCDAAGLQDAPVQFMSPTSQQVRAGLLEGTRVLYVRLHSPDRTVLTDDGRW
jgi:predicted nucleotidyltransferase